MVSHVARQIALATLARLNPGDVTIKHHWTGQPLRLHSFRHRNYWYRGAGRERNSMLTLVRLCDPGSVVYDVGGHIGYMTTLFAHLDAEVFAFEPGPNNLPYLRHNADGLNVTVVEAAVGAAPGRGELLVEDLTGQNNSMSGDYQLSQSMKVARGVKVHTYKHEVPIVTLDEFATEHPTPDLIKIDIEGYEWEALQGARRLFAQARPALLVEVTRESASVLEMMEGLGYVPLDDCLRLTDDLSLDGRAQNVFFLHRDRHARLLRQ